MNKVIYVILAATLMLNCGNTTGKAISNTDSLTIDSIVADTGMDKHSEAYIRQGVKIRENAQELVGYWGWVGDDCPELLLRLEMTDTGLEVTECNIYRLYGFDKATASFNGRDLNVYELDYDEETQEVKKEFHFDAHFDINGDLTGDCHIKHPLASREYEGPLTLRKDYFKYRDGAKRH